ncbi:MAG: helix-hairpin-helix domain-containing protein [Tannerella sp.]|jgi:hypothetical protein|nr:helix-hairpin-helix domain-containing protein [Tannerella sp.]
MKKRLMCILLITLLISCYQAVSQTVQSVDKWMEYVDDLAEELEDTEQVEILYSDLSNMTQHPLNINAATSEEFKRLPFLSDVQIDAILNYRKRYGDMATLYELKNITVLDWETIELLLPFVYVAEQVQRKRPLTPKNILKYGANELVMRYDRSLQEKQGYQEQPDSILEKYPNRKYLGEPFYHSFRYSYTFDDRLQTGFVAEKDAGEPFWNAHHKVYDYYSAHVLLRNMGKLKTFTIGDYKASFGQGLVLSHDFTPGRSTILTQAERRNNGFRRHYSTNEADFLRGVASAVRWNDIEVSLFYSYRKLDATVADTSITSFKTDGLHRTTGDWEKRRTVTMQTYGGNIRYASPNIVIGVTGIAYDFGKLRVDQELKPYNLYYFRGTQNVNASIDYLFKYGRTKVYGETAISENGAWATLNALQWTPVSYVSGLVLYRSYAKDYQAYFGNAFSQSSTVQNEQGFYIGAQLTPVANWKVSAYADFFRFPWLKYGVDAPSSGKEYMAQIDYSVWRKLSTYLRYRYRQKESNQTIENQPEVSVLPYEQHRIRWQMIYTPTTCLNLRSSVDFAMYKEEEGSSSNGWMISQRAGWTPGQLPLQADLYIAYFHTDDYASRLISYEKNLLYVYNTPSFYGEGMRMAFVLRYYLLSRLSLTAKAGWTHYLDDRETIGTGLEAITGKDKTDLSLMLQWKF